MRCHGMHNFTYVDSSKTLINLSVDSTVFFSSVHGKLRCQACHPAITEYPHNVLAAGKSTCASDCHASKDSKPYDHKAIYETFLHSVHGKSLTGKDPDAPTCLTCHGGSAHVVQPVKKVMTVDEKMMLCVSCHGNRELMVKHKINPDPVSSYKNSFHWKAIHYGYKKTAVCEDCHTNHSVLPPDNSSSTTNPAHLAQTCGQTNCHPGAKMNFAMSGANHLALRIEKTPFLFYEEKFFYVLTGGTIMMLLVGIVLDVQRKFGWIIVIKGFFRYLNTKFDQLGVLVIKVMKFLKSILVD
ncbi:MAG: cytochrome c3 family protein [Ignavibacteriaceae bacterium]